ncbi:hypothetical protein quinque_009022 [Culex quinquefasciatus]
MSSQPSSSAVRALSLEYKSLQEEPVEGFRVKLLNEDNLFEWEVAIFGPPDTLYQGGYFKAHMKFPPDYPYSPPSIRFLTKVWHPNVYENGDLCISILHPPVDDPQSGELPCERWNPTQNVRTILLSVISLLNEPNTFSPANVDASVMYRRWRDSQGKDNEYPNIIRKQAQAAKAEAEKEGIVVPTTLEEYCIKSKTKPSSQEPQPSSSAVRALSLEYKSLQEEPVEGFRVKLLNEDNLFEWEVAIFGPPDTLYQGGYFKAHMKFPPDYPYSPPSIRFLTKVWHPNVYENGDLCISILHPPVDDPQSGELPCERWNPTQNVRTILLSVISLLNEPNTFSPANVDASVMYRRWRDSQGKDNEYPNIIRKQAQAAKAEAEKEGIVVPTTLEEYCIKSKTKPSSQEPQLDMTDFYDDDYDLDTEDDDQSVESFADGDDSGNGES